MATKRKQNKEDFSTQIGRIVASAVAVFGEKAWLAPVAKRVGVCRNTLYRYLRGNIGMKNVDGALLRMLEEERAGAYARANRIAGAELRLANHLAAEKAANAGTE